MIPRIGHIKLNTLTNREIQKLCKDLLENGNSGRNRRRNIPVSAAPPCEGSTSCSTVPWTGR